MSRVLKRTCRCLRLEATSSKMHEPVFTEPQLRVARNTAYQIQPRPMETEECPLCRIVLGKSRRAFVTHIARHMEEIALMALPRSTEEDSDESSISTDQVSRGSFKTGMLAAETHNLRYEKERASRRLRCLCLQSLRIHRIVHMLMMSLKTIS